MDKDPSIGAPEWATFIVMLSTVSTWIHRKCTGCASCGVPWRGSRVGGVRVQGPVPRGRGSEKRSAISVQRSKGPGTKKAPAIRKAAGLNPRWQRVLGILHRRMPEFAARSYRIASKIQDVVVLA